MIQLLIGLILTASGITGLCSRRYQDYLRRNPPLFSPFSQRRQTPAGFLFVMRVILAIWTLSGVGLLITDLTSLSG